MVTITVENNITTVETIIDQLPTIKSIKTKSMTSIIDLIRTINTTIKIETIIEIQIGTMAGQQQDLPQDKIQDLLRDREQQEIQIEQEDGNRFFV